jgi:probable phosphoglycerate mutase
MNLTIYLLRHGQTELSRADNFCGSGLDPELTPDGLKMAKAFAEAYRTTPWRRIYSSGLKRAINTARPLCDALGISLQMRDGLNEIAYGAWEGLSKEKVEEIYRDDYRSWLDDPARFAPTGGELATAVAERALQVIEEIKQGSNEGRVLVVSHKATIRIILCSLLGIDVAQFRYRLACPVGSVSVVEFTSHGPLLQVLGDRSHLSESLRSLPGT